MKSLIKKIIKENNQKLINNLLDKISEIGYDNLSDYEKSVLNSISSNDYKFESMGKDVIEFLDNTYGEFIVEPFVEKTWGGKFTEIGYNFMDDNLDLMMKMVIKVNGEKRNVVYISNDIITHLDKFKLSEDEMYDVIVSWLNKNYSEFNFKDFTFNLLF